MKKITAFLVCMALTTTIFARSEIEDVNLTDSAEPEKIYVSSDLLQFHDNGIYVLHNDQWLQVPAIYSDKKGLFVECKQASPDTWYCSECRTYHNRDQKCPQAKKKRQ